jgi:hypothetical protein
MTQYATHRFSVGQQVACATRHPSSCEVTALVAGPHGPEYRIRALDGSGEAIVAERDLAYARASASTVPVSQR